MNDFWNTLHLDNAKHNEVADENAEVSASAVTNDDDFTFPDDLAKEPTPKAEDEEKPHTKMDDIEPCGFYVIPSEAKVVVKNYLENLKTEDERFKKGFEQSSVDDFFAYLERRLSKIAELQYKSREQSIEPICLTLHDSLVYKTALNFFRDAELIRKEKEEREKKIAEAKAKADAKAKSKKDEKKKADDKDKNGKSKAKVVSLEPKVSDKPKKEEPKADPTDLFADFFK